MDEKDSSKESILINEIDSYFGILCDNKEVKFLFKPDFDNKEEKFQEFVRDNEEVIEFAFKKFYGKIPYKYTKFIDVRNLELRFANLCYTILDKGL